MKAIYKRELKSYLTSMIGYLFIFFLLVLTGIYFSAYQLSAAYPKFEYTLSSLTFVFLIGVPILTMRVFAEERKQKTDQLLLTSPVSVTGIVIGKFLALVTIFSIPVLMICIYPLVMAKYGTVDMAAQYTAILGFFLLGCTNLAVGMYLSAITESQVIASVLTFVVLFAFFMMNGISSNMIWNILLSAAVCIIGEIAVIITYIINASVFEGGIQKILSIFNLTGHFENFTNSILDVNGILYYVSFMAVCIFLTIQSIVKRRWN